MGNLLFLFFPFLFSWRDIFELTLFLCLQSLGGAPKYPHWEPERELLFGAGKKIHDPVQQAVFVGFPPCCPVLPAGHPAGHPAGPQVTLSWHLCPLCSRFQGTQHPNLQIKLNWWWCFYWHRCSLLKSICCSNSFFHSMPTGGLFYMSSVLVLGLCPTQGCSLARVSWCWQSSGFFRGCCGIGLLSGSCWRTGACLSCCCELLLPALLLGAPVWFCGCFRSHNMSDWSVRFERSCPDGRTDSTCCIVMYTVKTGGSFPCPGLCEEQLIVVVVWSIIYIYVWIYICVCECI